MCGEEAERRVGGPEREAVAAGLDVEDCVVACGDVLALAPAGGVEPAQEAAPFALKLRLRSPARDERRAVARPGDAEKVAVGQIVVCALASGAKVFASRIETDAVST